VCDLDHGHNGDHGADGFRWTTTGRYRTIVADPPWKIGAFPPNFGYAAGKPVPYRTLTVEEIKALPVGELADGFAHLYLWTINDYLEDAFSVARAWGFEPSATLVWCKKPAGVGLGGVFASNVEFILFCRARSGDAVLRVTSALADAADQAGVTREQVNRAIGVSDMAGWWLSRLRHRCAPPTWEQYQQLKPLLRLDDSLDLEVRRLDAMRSHDAEPVETRWFTWPRGVHSAKPDAFLDLVEQVSPGPYLELFARRQRLGWDTWGNEALEHVELVS
jgi:N6-adenosine-specific RNA methylase IME4